jgi:cytolysin (calcineurin-like family phosphatase)
MVNREDDKMNKKGEVACATMVLVAVGALTFGHIMHVTKGWGPQSKTIDTASNPADPIWVESENDRWEMYARDHDITEGNAGIGKEGNFK